MSPKETVNAIINPWTTKEDGKFLFLVPPGTYQLSVDLPNYIFPFASSQLNSNYGSAYYELYYGSGHTDKNIIEVNIEHRDIPVIPVNTPFRGPVKLLGYMSELDKEKQIYKISGRASHPLTIVEIQGKDVESGKVTRTLTQVIADKWGFFDAVVNTSSLKQNETVGMAKLTKVDLTQTSSIRTSNFIFDRLFSWIQKSYAEIPSSTYSINSILNYIEGYAYDIKGKLIPNAKVGIYISGSKIPYYETFTDDKGYYVIASQYLPQMNYVIRYISSDAVANEITQSTFLKKNFKTIVSKKININAYITKLSPFKVSAQEREQLAKQIGQNNKYSPIKMIDKNRTTQSGNLAFIFLIILSFGGGIVGLVFYLKNRQKRPLN